MSIDDQITLTAFLADAHKVARILAATPGRTFEPTEDVKPAVRLSAKGVLAVELG